MSQAHSLRPVLRGILLDVAPPLIAYYGLRAAGVSEYIALLAGTVIAGVKVSTSDARMLMAGNTLVGGIGALLFLGTCLIGRPLTQISSERVRPATDDTPGPGEAAFRHRVHVSLSAMWGIGLLIGMLISLTIIFSLPTDVANGVNTVASLALTALLMAATVVVAKRARAKGEHLREQTQAHQG